ncbi:hypothetical protein BGX28_005927 [Mortierella sp. GBA30]|nr:hypothetical protein BGX28_005927 [Mortierella sp. GBA30]
MDMDNTPSRKEGECKRRNSVSPPSCSSSSEAEDAALLEEVTRIKARLEAKLRAKLLRKKTRSNEHKTQESLTDNQVGTGSERKSTITPDEPTRSTGSSSSSAPEVHMSNKTPPANPSSSHTDEVTPPTKRTPLVSPGFRTPSPPPRTRFLMSPPSGASSRKRQHSPSPLPRRSSASMLHARYGASTPTRSLQQQRPLTEDTRAGTEADNMDIVEGSNAGTQSVESEIDLPDEDFEDDFFDSVLDLEDFDEDEPEASEPTDRLKESVLTTLPSASPQRQIRTFPNIAAGNRSLSTAESIQLGHTPDFDPLTGLRIRDRALSCEDVAKMTHDLQLIPIEDSDRIRENTAQRPMTGVLSSGTMTSGLTGRLSRDSIITKKGTTEPLSKSWIIAGVVGAKSKQRTTAKKDPYCLFQLCDLRRSTINVFMFRTVMEKHHGKLRVGDVVALLEPKVLNQAERSGTVGVEVVHPDCLLVIGVARDFGLCEAVKKNGDNCGKILDRRGSVYCTYHIMMASNKRRNQRGSLLVGTTSIYDLEKPQTQPHTAHLPRRLGGGAGLPNPQSGQRRMMAGMAKETTYVFDNGGVVTSAMVDPKNSKGSRVQKPDEELSTFLMNQNNPGGQYLRQAKASKDVTWAKDVTSPKTPTKSSELFPSEMIRRMGYDPVSGQFVHGSPKRSNDDPEARERSLRLLAERVKSPPGPISPVSATLTSGRSRTIEVHAQDPHSSTTVRSNSAQKWVDIDDRSDSDQESGSDMLSLSQQRTKNLMKARAASSSALLSSAPRAAVSQMLRAMPTTEILPQSRIPQANSATPLISASANDALANRSHQISKPGLIPAHTLAGSDDGTGLPAFDTQPQSIIPVMISAPASLSTAPPSKKPKFVDLSDSD